MQYLIHHITPHRYTVTPLDKNGWPLHTHLKRAVLDPYQGKTRARPGPKTASRGPQMHYIRATSGPNQRNTWAFSLFHVQRHINIISAPDQGHIWSSSGPQQGYIKAISGAAATHRLLSLPPECAPLWGEGRVFGGRAALLVLLLLLLLLLGALLRLLSIAFFRYGEVVAPVPYILTS